MIARALRFAVGIRPSLIDNVPSHRSQCLDIGSTGASVMLKRASVNMRLLVGSGVVFVLAGCGGGSGGSVPPASTRSTDVTVSWVVPSTNVDGTPLTDLAGFRVHYGTSPGALSRTLDVSGASTTSADVAGLSSGTWYFAVGAINNAGIESDPTNVAARTIP